MGAIQCLLLLGQIIALVITIQQSRVATDAAFASVRASQRSAKAAEDAVAKSDEILTHAQESSRTELRAYVSIDLYDGSSGTDWVPEIRFGVEGRSQMPITLKNHGDTPALNVRVAGNIDIFPLQKPGKIPLPKPRPDSSKTVLFPNNPLYPTKIEALRVFSAADKMRVRAETHAIYAFGQVVYTDVFGRSHYTCFRYVVRSLNGKMFFAECPEGNYTDDNPGDRRG